MSRDDGFPIADVDTGLFSDAKVKALARRLKDPHLTAEYLCLWTAVLLESWGEGEPVSFIDAAPAWYTDDVDAAAAVLNEVGLLMGDYLPPDSWSRWFGPAWERREKRRQSGRQGGLASGKHSSSDAEPTVEPRSSDAEPVRPSVLPSDNPSVSGEASNGKVPTLRPMRAPAVVKEFAAKLKEEA